MAESQSTAIPLLSAAVSQSTSAFVSQSMSLPLAASQSTAIPLFSGALSRSTSLPLLSVAEGQSTSGTISAQLSTHMSLAFNNFQQNVAEGQAITHQSTEKSNLTYLDILNEHADSIFTMLELL